MTLVDRRIASPLLVFRMKTPNASVPKSLLQISSLAAAPSVRSDSRVTTGTRRYEIAGKEVRVLLSTQHPIARTAAPELMNSLSPIVPNAKRFVQKSPIG